MLNSNDQVRCKVKIKKIAEARRKEAIKNVIALLKRFFANTRQVYPQITRITGEILVTQTMVFDE